jgi:hypothetical protein
MIKEKIGIFGEYQFIIDGKMVRIVKNQLIKERIHSMRNLLLGYIPDDLSIRYCALGTGTTPATEDDETLDTEGARIYRTNLYGSGNIVVAEFTFTSTVAVGTWSEIGIFNGINEATSSADTGYLYSRAILDPTVEKTTGKELTIRHVTTWNY